MKKVTTILLALLFTTVTFAQEKSDKDDAESAEIETRKVKKNQGTSYGMNFDLGLNNYLQDGKSPEDTNEAYSARPMGSWTFAINSVNRTHIGGPLYLQWGGSVNWYSFKFNDETMRVSKDNLGVTFTSDPRTDIDPIKSKLNASYINVSMLPVLRFGDKSRNWDNDWCFDHDKGNGFRIGVGGYAGYKISSSSKFVYEDQGDKRKEKNKDSYYLNNWRYGARLQLGFRAVDLFVNYDISELFVQDKGPQLNAFSFGITI
jgi:hypothetical protein